VAIQFTIDGSGKVVGASVAESTWKHPGFGECIAERVRRWEFPWPEDGKEVRVLYPFTFDPG